MSAILNTYEYRLHDIDRWAVVRTIRKQTVAEHSYYVALIAPRIAREVFETTIDNYTEATLTRYALLHDQWEAFSGDFPGMVKDCVDEDKIKHRYVKYVREVQAPTAWMRAVVKVADLYERCYFLATELSMGNKSLYEVYQDNIISLKKQMKISAVKDSMIFKLEQELHAVVDARIQTLDLRDAKA